MVASPVNLRTPLLPQLRIPFGRCSLLDEPRANRGDASAGQPRKRSITDVGTRSKRTFTAGTAYVRQS